MPLDVLGPQFYDAPPTRIDGFPAAITTDLSIDNDLSDKGTGIGLSRPWEQSEIDAVAARTALFVDPSRRK